jgi:hypothetical protein
LSRRFFVRLYRCSSEVRTANFGQQCRSKLMYPQLEFGRSAAAWDAAGGRSVGQSADQRHLPLARRQPCMPRSLAVRRWRFRSPCFLLATVCSVVAGFPVLNIRCAERRALGPSTKRRSICYRHRAKTTTMLYGVIEWTCSIEIVQRLCAACSRLLGYSHFCHWLQAR